MSDDYDFLRQAGWKVRMGDTYVSTQDAARELAREQLQNLHTYYSETHEGKSLLLYDDVLELLARFAAPEHEAAKNTDREIWRGKSWATSDDTDRYYADSIHVTKDDGIGLNCGGYVIVKPIREWFALAASREAPVPQREELQAKLLRLLETGQHNDTCSYALSEEYACDCWKAKLATAIGQQARGEREGTT